MRFIICLAVVLTALCRPAFADTPWYEGGTLQKAGVADWRAATPENQLATSADFVAASGGVPDISALKNPGDVAVIRQRSVELRDCINQSIQPDTPEDRTVAEFVVICTILKKNK